MISRPVAVARSFIVAGVIWGLGALVVVALFRLFDASATIDVQGDADRVQIVWLGAHAFVGCVAVLLGVALGASALTRSAVDRPRAALLVVGTATLLAAVVTAVALSAFAGLDSSTLSALLVGFAIGAAGATIFVAQSADSDPTHPYGSPAGRSGGRSWSSR